MVKIPAWYADQPELVDAVVEARRVQMNTGDTAQAIRELMESGQSFSFDSATRVLDNKTFRHPGLYPDGHPGVEAAKAHLKERGDQRKRRQQMRYVSVRKRKAVLERDGYRCVYCSADLHVELLAIDHIVPVAADGTNDIDNLQATCQTCNARKKDFTGPDADIRKYLARRREQDLRIESVSAVLSPIVTSLVWPDSQESRCPWCGDTSKKAGEIDEFPSCGFVWRCKPCKRYFAVTGMDGIEEFLQNVQSAILGSWYADEEVVQIVVGIVKNDPQEKTADLVAAQAGEFMQVKKRRHRHRSASEGCWCEFGVSEFTFIGDPIKQMPVPVSY